MTIKTWIIVTINFLLITVVIILYTTFYQQFKEALDQRVLLQLKSIKRLKRAQIEDFIQFEWNNFNINTSNKNIPYYNEICRYFLKNTSDTGIYDITHLNPNGKLLIGMIKNSDNGEKIVKILTNERIQYILLERTGMGNSGETYLVGEDFKLRSQSRFFPSQKPFSITANTESVKNSFLGKNGQGIFPDYRGTNVYTAYHQIKLSHLKLVILSEIDVEEATAPLNKLNNKLLFITSSIIIITLLLSLYLARIFSTPLRKMQQSLISMSHGKYDIEEHTFNFPLEINEMFNALHLLKNSLDGAVNFSLEIGKMNLKNSYQPKTSTDLLGHSLLKMRDKLLEYQNQELKERISSKKLIIAGQEAERKRISRELHDGIGPLLTSLKLYIQSEITNPKNKDDIKKILDETIDEIRQITFTLMPASLVDFGISQTLDNFVKFMQKSSKIDIKLDVFIEQGHTKITTDLSIAIFRICQELTNNTIKHAQAEKIRITLHEFENYVSLFYFDDGIGFDIEKITLGAGIINMKERVEIFNGYIDINSKKNNFTVEIEIPLNHG